MKTQYAFALLPFLACTLTGCPGKPDPHSVASTDAIPIATEPTTECKPIRPASVTGPTGEVTEGTYCVCEGKHNIHGDYEGPHLAKGDSIVISTVDLVTDVQLGAHQVAMLASPDHKELRQVVNYQHKITAGGGGANVNHLVLIEPAAVSADENPGCSTDPSRNTLKITFCNKSSGQWACGRDAGDFGDTHVQN